jgi:hypothetical protein
MQCPHETGQQFFAIELSTVAILFYYLWQAQLNCFIGGKAFIARKTPPAAAYSVAFLAHPGVDDACIIRIAEGAFHNYSKNEAAESADPA